MSIKLPMEVSTPAPQPGEEVAVACHCGLEITKMHIERVRKGTSNWSCRARCGPKSKLR